MSSSGNHSGHRSRMRKRFLETGIDGFQPHEIMELLLFYAIPRANTNNTAHDLVKSFNKNIPDILNADADALASVKGISKSSASLIAFMGNLCKSYALSVHRSFRFTSSADIEKYSLEYFSGCDAEMLLFISVSNDFNLIDTIAYPTTELDLCSISPRELTELALRNNLHRIVAVRYYPGRKALPSDKDYYSIRFLTETLAPLGIEVCDYVLCGSNHAFSMKKAGAFSFR